MIVIVSNEYDYSTNTVIKYLKVNGFEYVRLTENLFIDSINIQLTNSEVEISFSVKGKKVSYNDISSFWYRKNRIELFSELKVKCPLFFSERHKKHLEDFIIREEMSSLHEFLIFMLEQKHHLGNFFVGNANKLKSFVCALNSGLKIPNSMVSSKLEVLKKFTNNIKTIAKPIEEGYYYGEEDYSFFTKNKLFDKSVFEEKIDNSLFPSCLQEYIDKKIELRIFFLNGKCYSMAIFSQSDEKTRIDFRNYNEEKPNRMVPYNLPEGIENNIASFMLKMELRTGSIDMVLTKENEYVFLEVNPVGQYGFVARHCNYPIDSLVFNYLTI